MAPLAYRTWRFDASPSSNAAAVRVVAFRGNDAVQVAGAREQVVKLYGELCASAESPMARVMTDVAKAFEEDSPYNYAVFAYLDNEPAGVKDGRIVACTRVSSCTARVTVSSIAVDQELPGPLQQAVTRAIVVASDELAHSVGKAVLSCDQSGKSQSIMIWQAQVGASTHLKELHTELGYNTELAQRLEMTAFLTDNHSLEEIVPVHGDVDITFRPWDLVNDNFEVVYGVLKGAFGTNPPSLEAWKRHFAQHPRFADELSFIAWHGDRPACVVAVEYMVDGEGGGTAELLPLFATDRLLAQEGKEALPPAEKLQFPENYEECKSQIRAVAKTAYVCCVGTAPGYRGKRLAQRALRLSIQKAAKAGLETMYLSTDRQNPAAVKAYERAGMEVTKVTDLGNVTAKQVTLDP